MRFALLAVLLAWLSLTACVAPVAVTPVTGEVSFADFSFSQSRDQVFDLALAVAQRLNLNVAVLEKSSGLLRFESAVLSADQLDKYCVYPYKPGQYQSTSRYFRWVEPPEPRQRWRTCNGDRLFDSLWARRRREQQST